MGERKELPRDGGVARGDVCAAGSWIFDEKHQLMQFKPGLFGLIILPYI